MKELILPSMNSGEVAVLVNALAQKAMRIYPDTAPLYRQLQFGPEYATSIDVIVNKLGCTPMSFHAALRKLRSCGVPVLALANVPGMLGGCRGDNTGYYLACSNSDIILFVQGYKRKALTNIKIHDDVVGHLEKALAEVLGSKPVME